MVGEREERVEDLGVGMTSYEWAYWAIERMGCLIYIGTRDLWNSSLHTCSIQQFLMKQLSYWSLSWVQRKDEEDEEEKKKEEYQCSCNLPHQALPSSALTCLALTFLGAEDSSNNKHNCQTVSVSTYFEYWWLISIFNQDSLQNGWRKLHVCSKANVKETVLWNDAFKYL